MWAADPIIQHGGATATPTVPPLLTFEQLVLDVLETAASRGSQWRVLVEGHEILDADPGSDGTANEPRLVYADSATL
jgi:hypothetical protein